MPCDPIHVPPQDGSVTGALRPVRTLAIGTTNGGFHHEPGKLLIAKPNYTVRQIETSAGVKVPLHHRNWSLEFTSPEAKIFTTDGGKSAMITPADQFQSTGDPHIRAHASDQEIGGARLIVNGQPEARFVYRPGDAITIRYSDLDTIEGQVEG